MYGDGVNIAARLEGLAEPGGITISDAVQGAVRGKVSANFTDQGEQQVKNIPHPVRTFRVHVSDLVPAPPATIGSSGVAARDKPSIAVLPFKVLPEDSGAAFLADGLEHFPIILVHSLSFESSWRIRVV
ncbi:MAG: hypothetical protein FJX60_21530 [Alphaproteobacteria bacterium]|nr:hypothetical protein [Alphaproteobacteria bacterium]